MRSRSARARAGCSRWSNRGSPTSRRGRVVGGYVAACFQAGGAPSPARRRGLCRDWWRAAGGVRRYQRGRCRPAERRRVGVDGDRGAAGGVRHAMDVAGGHCHQLALAVHVGDGGVAKDEALLADGTHAATQEGRAGAVRCLAPAGRAAPADREVVRVPPACRCRTRAGPARSPWRLRAVPAVRETLLNSGKPCPVTDLLRGQRESSLRKAPLFVWRPDLPVGLAPESRSEPAGRRARSDSAVSSGAEVQSALGRSRPARLTSRCDAEREAHEAMPTQDRPERGLLSGRQLDRWCRGATAVDEQSGDQGIPDPVLTAQRIGRYAEVTRPSNAPGRAATISCQREVSERLARG